MAEDEQKTPSVVLGVELETETPKGWTPYDVVVITKCIDSEGVSRLGYVTSKGWSKWEILGAFEGFIASLKQDMVDLMTEDPDDSDDS